MRKPFFGTAVTKLVVSALLLSCLVSQVPPAHAEGTNSAVTERAAELKEFRELLRNDDALVRLAAFEHGMKSQDAMVRKITLQEGFGSKDEDMRSLALKLWLGTRESIIAELELPSQPSKAQEETYKAIGSSVQFTELKIKPNGEIEAAGHFGRYLGQLIPAGLHIKGTRCELRLAVADAKALSGRFGCGTDGALPVLVRIE